MDTLINIPDKKGKKRIVIIGGGFGGLQAAKKLDDKQYQIVLIDKINYYQFQPLMYQVAASGLEPSSISYPFRKIFRKKKDFHIRVCEATSVNAEKNILHTSLGEIGFDYLIIASGCDTNYFGNDSLKDTTYTLKSVSEAILIRNKILISFEEALSAKDKKELKELMVFVIVGGGATGVELAGALADMKKTILPKDYPELDFSNMQIHLVDASPRLLSGMSEEASKKAAETLSKRGVIIHQNKAVNSYADSCVEMADGEKIFSRNVFWVAGVKPNSLPGLKEDSYNRGRLLVNEFNQVNGYSTVFAIGDTALMISDKTPKGHPQVAQVAIQMAANLAKNLNEKAKGKDFETEFRYRDRGSLATIGRNAAVADLGKFRFSGRLAWWLWLWVHILSIVGMKNKLMVFIDWVWSYISYDASLRLLILPKYNKIYNERKRE